MKIFALAKKPADYTGAQLFADLVEMPASFHWDKGAELIEIRLPSEQMPLADRINWPLLRECWRVAHGIHPLSEIRLEPLP